MYIKKQNSHGFTIIEALCGAAIITSVILIIPELNKFVVRHSLQMEASVQTSTANAVIDQMLGDFKTANYLSLLNAMPTPPGATADVPWFAKYKYVGETRQTQWVSYTYTTSDETLRRYQTTVTPPTVVSSTMSVLLTHAVPSYYLESTSSNIINFSLSYQPRGGTATIVKRRAAVRG